MVRQALVVIPVPDVAVVARAPDLGDVRVVVEEVGMEGPSMFVNGHNVHVSRDSSRKAGVLSVIVEVADVLV